MFVIVVVALLLLVLVGRYGHNDRVVEELAYEAAYVLVVVLEARTACCWTVGVGLDAARAGRAGQLRYAMRLGVGGRLSPTVDEH